MQAWRWWLLAATLLLGFQFSARAARFTASFDRNPITLGESAVLSLTFEGGQPSATPSLPEIPNLVVSSPPGFSSQFSFIAGGASSTQSQTYTYTYTVTPAQPGDYTIPAIRQQIGDQTVVSQPVKLVVMKPGAPTPAASANGGNAVAFIRLLVPKQKVYVGEVIQARLELCLREDVVNIQNVQLEPVAAAGFTTGKTQEGQR